MALLSDKINKTAKSSSTTTTGISQYFFFFVKKRKISLINENLWAIFSSLPTFSC